MHLDDPLLLWVSLAERICESFEHHTTLDKVIKVDGIPVIAVEDSHDQGTEIW